MRGVRVPLAYWKVVVWRVPGLKVGLRSLGFLVRQDAEVWAAVAAAAGPAGVPQAPRPVRGFEDTPTRVQGYQVPVRKIEELTGLRFGRVAGPRVDVLARQRAGGMRSLAPGKAAASVRTLGSIADLVLE